MKKKNTEILHLNLRRWKKEETRYCELRSVTLPKKSGEPIVFRLTPRGAKELKRREKEEALEQSRIRRQICGVDPRWLLFGPFCSDGTPVFS